MNMLARTREKIDIKTDHRFTYARNPDNVNANLVSCNHCRFKHANTFLGCTEAAEIHAFEGHWRDPQPASRV